MSASRDEPKGSTENDTPIKGDEELRNRLQEALDHKDSIDDLAEAEVRSLANEQGFYPGDCDHTEKSHDGMPIDPRVKHAKYAYTLIAGGQLLHVSSDETSHAALWKALKDKNNTCGSDNDRSYVFPELTVHTESIHSVVSGWLLRDDDDDDFDDYDNAPVTQGRSWS